MGSKIFRLVLIVLSLVLVAAGLNFLRQRQRQVDSTTAEIEDTLSALDPAMRAAVVAKLSADGEKQVKAHFDK